MKKTMLAVFACLLLAGCTQQAQLGPDTGGTLQAREISVTLKIFDRENSPVLEKQLSAKVGETVFGLLQANNVQMEYDTYPIGVFVKGIAGIRPVENEYIAVYINDQYAQEGISTLRLEDGMAVEFRFEEISNETFPQEKPEV